MDGILASRKTRSRGSNGGAIADDHHGPGSSSAAAAGGGGSGERGRSNPRGPPPSSSQPEDGSLSRSSTTTTSPRCHEVSHHAGPTSTAPHPNGDECTTAVIAVPALLSSSGCVSPQQQQQQQTPNRSTVTSARGPMSTEDTPVHSGLDTPDHHSSRGTLLRRRRTPTGLSPITPPTDVRFLLDESTADTHPAPSPNGRLLAGHQRERVGSVSRIEGTLVAMQVELANEKRSNIEAELTISSLRHEVEVLRAENRSLAALHAHGSGAAPTRPAGIGATGSDVEKYVEELEQRVARLTKALDAKQRELDSKDERVRLLEHKLVDRFLMSGGGAPLGYPSPPLAQEPAPTQRSSIPGQYLHRAEVRPVMSAGGGAPQPRGRASSALRLTASGAAAFGGEMPPPPRNTAAPVRRPSIGRRPASASAQGGGGSSGAPVDVSGRYRAASQPRSGPATSSASAGRPSSARLIRRDSSSTVLARHASSASRLDASRRLSSASAPSLRPRSPGPQRPRRPSTQRQGSVGRRGSDNVNRSNAVGPASPSASKSLSGAPATTVTTAGYANSTMYQRPPPLRSMMGAPPVNRSSPSRSATSRRSGTSTRSRPRITYDERGDPTSMQGTTTTVVFRAGSTSSRHSSASPAYTGDYRRMRPSSRDISLIPGERVHGDDSSSAGGVGSGKAPSDVAAS